MVVISIIGFPILDAFSFLIQRLPVEFENRTFDELMLQK
jgi:hypothetical protein